METLVAIVEKSAARCTTLHWSRTSASAEVAAEAPPRVSEQQLEHAGYLPRALPACTARNTEGTNENRTAHTEHRWCGCNTGDPHRREARRLNTRMTPPNHSRPLENIKFDLTRPHKTRHTQICHERCVNEANTRITSPDSQP